MKLEFAWLPSQRPLPFPAGEIVLEGKTPLRLLLLHGLTGTPSEFAYIAHCLHHRTGVSVECRRLVNHGQPLAVLARTSWRAIVASATEHVHRAHESARARGETLVVGGLSLGAVLALLMAAKHPDEVDGVIALSPTLFYDGWAVPWSHRLIALADYLPLKHVLYLRESSPYGLKDEALRARIAARYARMSLHSTTAQEDAREIGYAHFPLRLFCEMRHIITRCIAHLPQVKAPLLVLQAREDEVTSPRNAWFVHDRVASRRKEVVLLDNSYHLVTADLDRARVASEITRFCMSLVPNMADVAVAND